MIGLLAICGIIWCFYILNRLDRLYKHIQGLLLSDEFFEEWKAEIEYGKKCTTESAILQSLRRLEEYEKHGRERLERIAKINIFKVMIDWRIKIEDL